MKRILIIVLVALPSIALFAGLVHLVLVAANLFPNQPPLRFRA